MDELQFIVRRLSEKPFNIPIRAVDFDEKSPDEHLQILNDVLSSLNADVKADIRVAPRDDVVDQMVQFLLVHKCDRIGSGEDERLEWMDGIRDGRKEAVYPILHWVLSNYEHLRKRAYLSRYLMPVDVPTEYLMQANGNLDELLDAYKELQAEFIEAHKHYESTKANMDRPTSDVINGIKQMEAEEQQLLVRLQHVRAQTSNDSNFQRILAEASKMRQAQDDEIRLEEQKREQLHCLAAAKRRLHQARQILNVIKSCEGQPVDSILSALEREYQKSVDHLESSVIPQRHEVELTLLQAEKEAGLDKTEDDLNYLAEMGAQLEDQLNCKRDELNNLGSNHGDLGKLAALRQDAIDATSKLNEIEKDVTGKTLEKELLKSTNRELRDAINAMDGGEIQRPDGTYMNKHEFAEFQENLKRQLEVYADSKGEISKVQESIVKLKQTEDMLKSQHRDLQEHFQKEEERLGVTGFREISEQLEQTSKKTTSLNEQKSQTLDEISAMVQKIAHTLEGKKQKLEPKIEELKQKRKDFKELEERHSSEKARYDDAVTKLTNGYKDLENDCSRLQEEWLEKDRRYRLHLAKDEINASKLGNSPELGPLKELYESKISQQQTRAKELRAHRQGGERLKKDCSSNQKAMFTNLKKLLELKAQCSY